MELIRNGHGRGDDINSLDRSNYKVPPWAPVHGGCSPAPYPYHLGYIPSGSDEVMDRYPTKNAPGTGKALNTHHRDNHCQASVRVLTYIILA